jgi:hypothetical protein
MRRVLLRRKRERGSAGQELTVIWESGPWKDLLLTDATLLERWSAKARVTERRSMLIERKVFLAAYTIRKLYEAQKLSTNFRDRSFRCRTYPVISDRITHLNTHRLEKLYDFDRPDEDAIAARELIDLIVHSFVFGEFLRDDMTVDGFLVTSDRIRYDRLWFVEMVAFISFMRQVGNDYPSTAISVFNRNTNDWELWQGHSDPPAEFVRRREKILRDQWIPSRPTDEKA